MVTNIALGDRRRKPAAWATRKPPVRWPGRVCEHGLLEWLTVGQVTGITQECIPAQRAAIWLAYADHAVRPPAGARRRRPQVLESRAGARDESVQVTDSTGMYLNDPRLPGGLAQEITVFQNVIVGIAAALRRGGAGFDSLLRRCQHPGLSLSGDRARCGTTYPALPQDRPGARTRLAAFGPAVRLRRHRARRSMLPGSGIGRR